MPAKQLNFHKMRRDLGSLEKQAARFGFPVAVDELRRVGRALGTIKSLPGDEQTVEFMGKVKKRCEKEFSSMNKGLLAGATTAPADISVDERPMRPYDRIMNALGNLVKSLAPGIAMAALVACVCEMELKVNMKVAEVAITPVMLAITGFVGGCAGLVTDWVLPTVFGVRESAKHAARRQIDQANRLELRILETFKKIEESRA